MMPIHVNILFKYLCVCVCVLLNLDKIERHFNIDYLAVILHENNWCTLQILI